MISLVTGHLIFNLMHHKKNSKFNGGECFETLKIGGLIFQI